MKRKVVRVVLIILIFAAFIYFIVPHLFLSIYVKTKITENEFPLAFVTPRVRILNNLTDKYLEIDKVEYKNIIIYFPEKILKRTDKNEEVHLFFSNKKSAMITKKKSDLKTIHPDLINDTKINTEYDLYNESLTMTPSQISIFDSYAETKKKSRLLAYKAMYTAFGKNISKFKTKNIKGFQFGDPNFDDLIIIHIFDNMDKKYSIEFSDFRQSEIDFSIDSIKFD